jgi:hypothetical protein
MYLHADQVPLNFFSWITHSLNPHALQCNPVYFVNHRHMHRREKSCALEPCAHSHTPPPPTPSPIYLQLYHIHCLIKFVILQSSISTLKSTMQFDRMSRISLKYYSINSEIKWLYNCSHFIYTMLYTLLRLTKHLQCPFSKTTVTRCMMLQAMIWVLKFSILHKSNLSRSPSGPGGMTTEIET